MTENALLVVLRKVIKTAERIQVKVVIMGGMAVSIYSTPRATFDIDAIGDFDEERIGRFLVELKKQGFSFDEKNPVKEIAGLPFVTLYFRDSRIYFDLFIARSEFQKTVVRRARSLQIRDINLDVISPEDLILVKLISARTRDVEDIRQVLSENSETLDFSYLRHWADKLGQLAFLQDEMTSLGFPPDGPET